MWKSTAYVVIYLSFIGHTKRCELYELSAIQNKYYIIIIIFKKKWSKTLHYHYPT